MYFGFQNMTIGFHGKTVLEDVTLDIPRGKVVTIIGQNGCGKSSLLKTVSKAVTPRMGEVIYNDKPLKSYPPKQIAQHIAYLAQVHVSPPDIDVRTLVSYGRYPYLKLGHHLTAEDGRIIDETLRLTGLTALQHRTLRTLSGGERQRAWIAMTVCQQPEILILDEPTTYLDISYQMEVLELVRRLNREMGMTIVMVLHDLNMAARYSDMLYAIRGGRIFASGTPEEVICCETLRSVFKIEADITCDASHHCPYFIPMKILPDSSLDSVGESLSDKQSAS